MSTTITFRRGTSAPTSGAGLTLGEPAFDTTNRNLYMGLGHGVTAAWVGARISGSSADIASGLTNWIVNAKAVKDYVDTATVAGTTLFGTDISVNSLTVGKAGGNVATNTALGINVLQNNTTGNNNTGVGNYALSANDEGYYLTSIGSSAFRSLIGASANGSVAVGSDAGRYFGSGAGSPLEEVSNSVFIGYNSRASANGVGNEIVIGANAIGAGSNTVTIGDASTSLTRLYGTIVTNCGISAADGSTFASNVQINGNLNVTGVGGNVALQNQTNTFTALQTFNSGISAAGGITFNAPITGVTATFNGRINALRGICVGSQFNVASPTIVTNTIIPLTSFSGATLTIASPGDGGPTRLALQYDDGVNPVTYGTFVTNNFTANRSYTLPDDTGTLALTKNVVTSIDGVTGPINNVARTNISNTFTAVQNFTAGLSAAGGITFTGNMSVGATLTVSGNLIVNGTTTTINSTTISVDDKNIVLGDVVGADDTTAQNGGITLKGTGDKTLYWTNNLVSETQAPYSWNTNQNFNLDNSGYYAINGTIVLSGATLGGGVVSSSLTKVGTITQGTWNSDIVYVDGGTYT